ncbi:CRISPR-associated endonuclease Cas3'' [Actinacidiphila oryziradicis]|uniref:CRISPR-associated endonuclease Cas3 n=2 Tax=Actinacidiphila oryziradicis TaxID=2571141 RepID=A0A4U0RVN0_9ACTN|nr:CRISPR-associated endonuclease Cas3'' [Actinacidiphila oryziradicis]
MGFGGVPLSPAGKCDVGLRAVHPLLFHMLDVAAVAGELWDRFLTGSQRRVIADGLDVTVGQARRLTMFFAACHDLGKASRWQEREGFVWARVGEALRADTGGWQRMPHERASMHAALHLLADLGYDATGNDSPAVRVAQILGGHHGRYLQVDLGGAAGEARVREALGGAVWQDLRRRYVNLIRHLTGASVVPQDVSVTAAVLITAVGTVADRLASQGHYWLARAMAPAFGAAEHYARARKEAVGLVDRSGLARIDLPPVPFTQAHGGLEAPNDLQASLMEQLPPAVEAKGVGIVVVTDATGGGKTITALEAGRIFNDHCGTAGLCLLLPTTTVADAAYDTVEAYVAAHCPQHAPVALVYSHSWLNAAYADHQVAEAGPVTCDREETAEEEDDEEAAAGRGELRATVPDGWLRGWDRALLAQFTVATVDQGLMAVLPVRFNTLRLLALSGKTVIIDEAHAFTPFTQLQLRRLLHWLGALRCPVVVLSATLPASTGDELVRAYLAGAGRRRADLDGRSFTPPYPGWLFADAAGATRLVMDGSRRTAHADRQHRSVTVHTERVGPPPPDAAVSDATDPGGERLALIAGLIAPVAARGGCATVGCATVAAAQDTYRHLRDTLDWPDGPEHSLVLLHARFPGHRREALTRAVRAVLGPKGPRPERLVVVTTTMLDLGLDIDTDLMVSDLAALGRLLQRVGRLWRFENLWKRYPASRPRPRPDWIKDQGPRLTVLNPVGADGRTALPAAWRRLESDFLLHATAALLAHPPTRTWNLPDDVQHLVEQLHGTDSDFARRTRDLEHRLSTHRAAELGEEHHAACHLIPTPDRVSSLADLHRQFLTSATAATRLGTHPRRLLPCYRTRAGLTLDPDGRHRLPEGPLRPAQVRTVLEHTLPVPADWVAGRRPEHAAPDSWHRHALLADLILLPLDAAAPGTGQRFGRHTLSLDPELGLVHRED